MDSISKGHRAKLGVNVEPERTIAGAGRQGRFGTCSAVQPADGLRHSTDKGKGGPEPTVSIPALFVLTTMVCVYQ